MYFCPSICLSPYPRNHTPCTRHFFHLLEIFVLHAVREGPNYRLSYCLCHLSAIVLVHWCKIMRYEHVFFIFLNILVYQLLGDKKEKRPKKPIMLSRQFICNQKSYDHNFRYACVKKWYLHLRFFVFFWKFWFCGILEGWLLLSIKLY